MPRNGSGTFTRPVADYVPNTAISSTSVNTEMDGIATALTNSLAKNGETTPTANLPMGTYRHTGVGNASARTDYAAAGQVQDGSLIWAGTAGGTADALTLTLTPAITAYATGQKFLFKAGASPNTGAATVAINGLAAKAIEMDDAALDAGRIRAGKYYSILFDGTAFQLTELSSGVGGNATKALDMAGFQIDMNGGQIITDLTQFALNAVGNSGTSTLTIAKTTLDLSTVTATGDFTINVTAPDSNQVFAKRVRVTMDGTGARDITVTRQSGSSNIYWPQNTSDTTTALDTTAYGAGAIFDLWLEDDGSQLVVHYELIKAGA